MTSDYSAAAPRRATLLIGVLAFVAFVSLGLPDGVLGVAWPSVRQTFDLPVSRLGVLLTAAVCGSLVSSFLSGQVVRAIGVGKLLLVSSLLVAGAMAGIAATPIWHGAVVAMFVGGLGAGAIDAGINAFAAERFSPRIVTWLHACYGVGATGGPVLMTACLYTTGGWRLGYGVLAAMLAAMAALFAYTLPMWRTPHLGGDDRAAPGPAPSPAGALAAVDTSPPAGAVDEGPGAPSSARPAGMRETLARPIVWAQVLLFFVYAGIEVTAGQWLFSLLTESRGRTTAFAGGVVGMYWASLTIGRIVFGQLATRFSANAILRFATLAAPVAALLIARPPALLFDVAGAVLLGFALAPVYPLLISATPARVGGRFAAQSIGFQVSAATVGVAALPGLAGLIARQRGLESVPLFLIATSLILLVLHEASVRLARRTPSTETRGTPPANG